MHGATKNPANNRDQGGEDVAPTGSSSSFPSDASMQRRNRGQTMALMKPPSSPRTFVPSTFGRQVLSQRASCPAICFGTADRTTREKQYYSREMDKARIGLEGPGPIYETKVTSIGKQVTAQKESSPQVGFSLARRFITIPACIFMQIHESAFCIQSYLDFLNEWKDVSKFEEFL